MNSKHPKLYLILLIGLAALLVLFLVWQLSFTLHTQEQFLLLSPDSIRHSLIVKFSKARQKPQAIEAKGIYLTAYSAGSTSKIDSMIELIDNTELNAVIIDIKDYSGLVLYDSEVGMVNELGTEDNRLGDVVALIDKLHEHNIYVIARQTVFQDPVLAEKKTDWAIKSKNGGLWRDHKGLAWVDPTQQEVWEYNLEIAKEAIGLGFDEINFDYVRFPSDGNMSLVVYTNDKKEKYEVMHDFYHFLNLRLADEPAWVSLDLFGYAMERHDGMSIGQRLEDAVTEVDYISPMMYPSHYPSGHLGFDNPAEYPAAVFENGMKKGVSYFTSTTKAQVRPWLQAFNLGAVYDAEKIRAQIDVIEKYTDAGWLMWNASNRYSGEGLNR
jgi:hypothetical protein